MKTLSDWLLGSSFNIELQSPEDFMQGIRQPDGVCILILTEQAFLEKSEQFQFTSKLFGLPKTKTLYPIDATGKEFFFILPKEQPKQLGFDTPGQAHYVSYLGALLSSSLQSFCSKFEQTTKYYLQFSDHFLQQFSEVKYEFILGVLQKSISNKVTKNLKSENKFKLILNQNLFAANDLKKGLALNEAMIYTRSFVNMPPNILNPQSYEEFIAEIIQNENQKENSAVEIHMDVVSYEALKEQGCGLICAVGQGSAIKPRLIKLTYSPLNYQGKLSKIALVGKGITFDSGGYDIKPSSGMRIMKKDMGGSAAAFGIFMACAKQELPVHLTCWLPLAENMVSGTAMRPGDVYKAKNGLNIEIDNTDAEGRLVLADALTLAANEHPDWLIDLATLTGAARVSLGTMVDSLFGNHKYTTQMLYQTGIETGDWVWHVPMPLDYEGYLDSNISDLANSGTSGFAGSITAALFLQKFVGDTQWNHIDTYMWCDKPNQLWAEGGGATAKCVRLVTKAIETYILNI